MLSAVMLNVFSESCFTECCRNGYHFVIVVTMLSSVLCLVS
jgi:hypothetical protein